MKYYTLKFRLLTPEGNEIKDESLKQLGRELLVGMTANTDIEAFEDTDDGLNGYVQTNLFDKETLDEAIRSIPLEIKIVYEVENSEYKDWNEAWENEGFEPIVIGNRCVIHDTHNTIQGTNTPIDITIDARMAFGTGTHETTKMVVEALLDCDLAGKRVLDCGCGTGILSLVAAKKGASWVVAYDIDEWSVKNSMHNAELNSVQSIEVLHGDANVLSHINGLFDVVVANINRNILLADMPRFKDVMAAGAKLILSGFYTADSVYIAESAGKLGLSLVQSATDNDWCCLVLQSDE